MGLSKCGVDLQALIRENLMFLLGLPFKESVEVTKKIIEQCQNASWVEVVGDSYHVIFDRTWHKEQKEGGEVWRKI